jgi:hypothetical protein
MQVVSRVRHTRFSDKSALTDEERSVAFSISTPDRTVASRFLSVLIFLVLLLSALPLNAQVPPKTPPSWVLLVQDGRLTVNIDGAQLGDVLTELARQAHFRVTLAESTAKQVISRAFRDLPLHEGIDRLLMGHPHAVLYEEASSPLEASSGKKIREIVVLSDAGAPSSPLTDRSPSREANPKTGADADAMARVSAALQNPDPGVRLQGLEDWAQHPGGYSIEPLSQALVDPDESVRARAQQLFDHAVAIQRGDPTTPPPPSLPRGPEDVPRR